MKVLALVLDDTDVVLALALAPQALALALREKSRPWPRKLSPCADITESQNGRNWNWKKCL